MGATPLKHNTFRCEATRDVEDLRINVFEISCLIYHCLLGWAELDGVSILILANKQDLKGAYSADALRTELGISKLLRNQKRMLKVRGL